MSTGAGPPVPGSESRLRAAASGLMREAPAASEPAIAVIIPCYNEAATVQSVVADFRAALPHAEIYVFDNNSTDGTGDLAEDAGARVIRSPRQGKGNVLSHAFRVVHADVYVIADGDGTYPAAAAPEMIERFNRDRLDMLVGTRLSLFEHESFRLFHQFGNRLITGLINLLFRAKLRDVLSGYRILSPTFVHLVRLRRAGFEVETEMTLQALAKRLAIGELPVEYGSRPEDSPSQLSTWSDGWLIFRCIVLLFKDFRPLIFFASVSVLLAIAALLCGSAPIQDFIEHQYVFHVPRAILAAGLGILSVISLTAGLILDTVVRLHAESVEFWRHDMDHR